MLAVGTSGSGAVTSRERLVAVAALGALVLWQGYGVVQAFRYAPLFDSRSKPRARPAVSC